MGKKTDILSQIDGHLANHREILSDLSAGIGVLIEKENALRVRVEESNTLYNEFRAKYNDMLSDIRDNLDSMVRSGPDAVERRLIDVAEKIEAMLKAMRKKDILPYDKKELALVREGGALQEACKPSKTDSDPLSAVRILRKDSEGKKGHSRLRKRHSTKRSKP